MNLLKDKFFKNCITAFLFTFMILTLMAGCSKLPASITSSAKTSEFITKSGFMLDTYITINIYDKQKESILDGCFHLIAKYEDICSRTKETSELYALNNRITPHKGNQYIISDELADVIKYGLYYSKLSDGAFDISIEPVSSLWDFTAINPSIPSASDIKAALPDINYKCIHLNGNHISFDKDKAGIDLGAIAKGYIADKLKEYLLSKGVSSAMIDLGGNILCVGEKPDGSPFHVGIQKPFADRNEIVGITEIKDLSVVSSGIYERCFTVNHVLYHHILNPDTGYPCNNNLISVTIISKASANGDGLSTTCFALGLEKGLELVESLPDTYAVFITSDYKLYYSKGFKKALNFSLE